MTYICFIFDLPSTIEKKKDIYYEYELRNVGVVVFCTFTTNETTHISHEPDKF